MWEAGTPLGALGEEWGTCLRAVGGKVINAVHRFASFPGSDQESYGMRHGEGAADVLGSLSCFGSEGHRLCQVDASEY